MGINVGPEEFQRKMSETLSGLPGCEIIMDDILIHGLTQEEHDERLSQVLRRIENSGLKLNQDKCHFNESKVSFFFGHTISDSDVALLLYRTTPHSASGISPSVALMGRQLRTKVPVLSRNLQPVNHNDRAIRFADTKAKQDKKKFYNQRHGVRDLPGLQPGDAVRVKTGKQKKWTEYGRVMYPADSSGRSYVITSPCGVIRRNRQHLQKVPELPNTAPEPHIDLPEGEDTYRQEDGDGDIHGQEDGNAPGPVCTTR